MDRESLTIQLFWISQLHHLGLISAKKMESHWPSPDSDCSKRLLGKEKQNKTKQIQNNHNAFTLFSDSQDTPNKGPFLAPLGRAEGRSIEDSPHSVWLGVWMKSNGSWVAVLKAHTIPPPCLARCLDEEPSRKSREVLLRAAGCSRGLC